jgi:hypothetical protein
MLLGTSDPAGDPKFALCTVTALLEYPISAVIAESGLHVGRGAYKSGDARTHKYKVRQMEELHGTDVRIR